MILQNQIRCLQCGDEPYSAHRHDFKWCHCGAVAVDGGMDYLKRVGDPAHYKDISIDLPQGQVDELAQDIMKVNNGGKLTAFGVLCKIARVMRDIHGDQE